MPELSATVRRSGSATGGTGSIVNTGVMHLADRPVARSVYLQQVQQIFPFELVGRDSELEELEAFCTQPDGSSYVWWQGRAWAGKSALMAWFVLHPPTGVRVMSFFVTARFAGQSDQTAFLEIVLEQLAEVARQPMPDVTESNQQAWFGQLLHDAATACEEEKQRLVLLVDGLDEDLGVTTKPDAHSIAALLPAVPPTGVRVIVAGRPHPLVPADVPAWHPLRDKKIVRQLTVSPHAQMIRDDAERELDHLLDDRRLGRKLLGLVTVARGGLSHDDLVELSGEPPRTVDRTLRSVLGRTFYGRLNRWQVSAPPVFVLAHEELQQSAIKSLGRNELTWFLGQLHEWAERYRQRGWPAETPEYLLRGYHRVLVTIGDMEQMTALACDGARLDRMLDVSGGDAAALAEITAVQEFICGQDHPDLAAMLNLAIARDRLSRRNDHIPDMLPTIWVRLGNSARAEALASSITDPDVQARALATVAKALAEAGDLDQARQVAQRAEATARSSTYPARQARTLAAVAKALAAAGDLGRAEAAVRGIADPDVQARALVDVAEALGGAGDLDQARQVAQRAEAIARSISDSHRQAQAQVLAAATEALAGAGDLGSAEATARSITDPDTQAQALAAVAKALAGAGDLGRAEATARSITDLDTQAQALADVALGGAGDLDQARQVAQRAEATARSITDPDTQAQALADVAEMLAGAGDLDQARQVAQRAEAIARSITDPYAQAEALAAAAKALARAGDLGRAEATARSINHPYAQTQALAAVAEALAGAGDLGRAEAAVRAITDPYVQARTLAAAAKALARAGDLDQACQIAQRAEATARSITHPYAQTQALAAVAEALAGAGDLGRAEATARSITDPDARARALAAVAETLVEGEDLKQAETACVIGGPAGTAAVGRSRQLFATALAQTREYVSLLPLLVTVDPVAVIKVAKNFSHV